MSKPQIAPTRVKMPTVLQAVNPAIVSTWRAGPKSTVSPRFVPSVFASRSRSARVGKAEVKPATDQATIAIHTAPHRSALGPRAAP